MEKQCQCTTAKGTQCSRKALSGQRFCKQHQNCNISAKGTVLTISKVTPKTTPRIKAQEPQEVQVQPMVQPMVQPLEVTRARAQQKRQQCAICREYVRVREMLVPQRDYPPHLQNKDQIIKICGQCYQDCYQKCLDVMGPRHATDCKTNVCDSELHAMRYAQADRERLGTKLAGIAATRTALGLGTKYWPQVPKNSPK
jgi:hypothetical protein